MLPAASSAAKVLSQVFQLARPIVAALVYRLPQRFRVQVGGVAALARQPQRKFVSDQVRKILWWSPAHAAIGTDRERFASDLFSANVR